MACASPIRRIALTRALQADLNIEITRGVLAYSDRHSRWRFVGGGNEPFVDLGNLHLHQIDGVIGEIIDPSQEAELPSAGVSMVTISTEHVEALALPLVGNDDYLTGQMGAKHLLERGFTQLAFFGVGNSWLSERRMEGFRSAAEEAGRIVHVRALVEQGRRAPARDALRRWLAELPKPIAIMAHKDYLARVVVEVAVDLGMSVPNEVAVLGANNNLWASLLSPVRLSSVQPDYFRIGYLAAEALDAMMAGGTVPAPRFVPPHGVQARQSTDVSMVDDPLVSQAVLFIRQNCGRDIGVTDVLDHLHVSRSNLEKRMKRAIGLTPQTAITSAQVEMAKQLLLNPRITIDSIARASGFHHRPRLNEAFKRLTGMTPSQFRQQHHCPMTSGGPGDSHGPEMPNTASPYAA